MRMFKRLAMAASAAALLLGSAAGVASASTASARPQCPVSAVRLTGGQTSVTTAPGIAAALLGHGIVPLATLPGTEGASTGKSGIAVTFAFPVTGGSVNLKQLTGTIGHSGGIVFIAPASGKQIAVSDFVINLKQKLLTAIVNGNPKERVPLLSLSLAGAKVTASRHAVRVSGIVTRLTKTAASALDATFGTTLFTPGLELGTASTLVRF
jgi:Htaa protein